nr:MAG TPA: hypothetical protein [Caudoviricetes sp.]
MLPSSLCVATLECYSEPRCTIYNENPAPTIPTFALYDIFSE